MNLDAKVFKEWRKESKELLKIFETEEKYERKYLLLQNAYDKLLKVRYCAIE